MITAIAISGGDTRGAGGAARIAKMDRDFDLGVGISTGAIMLVPTLLKRHDLLKSHYTGVSQEDIFSSKVFDKRGNIRLMPIVKSLLKGKAYLTDTYPLKARLTQMFLDNSMWNQLQESKKEAIVGVFNMTTQKLEWKSSKDETMYDFIDYTIASASVPGLMKSFIKGENEYVDGGVVESCPLYYAALQGAEHVTAIKHAPKVEIKQHKSRIKNLANAIGRTVVSMRNEISRNDLTEGINYCDRNDITYEIHYISQGFYDKPMNFNKELMARYYSESFADNSNPLTNQV